MGGFKQRPMRKVDDAPVHDGSSRDLICADGIPDSIFDDLPEAADNPGGTSDVGGAPPPSTSRPSDRSDNDGKQ